MISIRTLSERDWTEWREMRLAALAEAPSAFASTVAEWTGAGDIEERWRNRLRTVPLNLLAYLDGQPVGMAGATAPASDRVELISMWVTPAARGRGVGDALVDAVISWAREHDVARVALDVREANHSAVALYQRNAFIDVGWASEPTDSFPERRLVRELGPICR
jgi:ribosomal protein S18 acetylase RimI-like enzyme